MDAVTARNITQQMLSTDLRVFAITRDEVEIIDEALRKKAAVEIDSTPTPKENSDPGQ